ncbi:MAG: hypothetical protein COA79_10370 [Planctomycetota bacterium]|nr:MAG: hypothetical protein COA79_10370 [Planctomycetota bacterium]
MKLKLVLLFDIDGTLIKTGGVGMKAMEKSFQKVFHQKDGMKEISFAGSTDLGIFQESLKNLDLYDQYKNQESEFRKNYLNELKGTIKDPNIPQEVLPGVFPFLEKIKEHEDIYTGLVTGNYKEGAKIKLEHFKLWDYFGEGAFGCDHEDRNILPAIALERIQEKGYQLPDKENIWIIGDTQKDTYCAHHNDLKSLILFTGFNTREEILNSKPTLTLENLEAYQEFLDIAYSE